MLVAIMVQGPEIKTVVTEMEAVPRLNDHVFLNGAPHRVQAVIWHPGNRHWEPVAEVIVVPPPLPAAPPEVPAPDAP